MGIIPKPFGNINTAPVILAEQAAIDAAIVKLQTIAWKKNLEKLVIFGQKKPLQNEMDI